MSIKYEAYTRLGDKVKGVLPTDSEDDAYKILEQDDLIPYRLRPVRPRPSVVQLFPSLFRPSQQDIINFTRQLAALLNSGIPLRRALSAQRDQTRSAGLKDALRQIIVDIEAGVSLSDAFSRHSSIFPEFYLRLLRVGEATGGITTILQQITESLRRRKGVADKIKKSLMYPAISLAVAFVAGFVLVTYSLPTLVDLMREFGGQLPLATRLMIATSDILRAYAIYFAGAMVGVTVLVAASRKSARGKWLWDRVLLGIPKVGGIMVASSMFSLTTSLSTLIKAGVPPVEALKLVEGSMGNAVFRARLAKVRSRVSEGTTLGAALDEQRGFPSLLAQAVNIGELRGNLIETLDGLADYYEDMTDTSVGTATELIQPAIILVIAGVVGFIAVAVISGIYTTLGTVH